MARVKHAVSTRRRKKRVLKKAKGQFGHRSKRYKQAKISVVKGMAYAYRDRRVKKRSIKQMWVARINAACKENGISYSRFINGLKKTKTEINRKMLAELAVSSPSAFKKLVKQAKEAGPAIKTRKTAKKEK